MKRHGRVAAVVLAAALALGAAPARADLADACTQAVVKYSAGVKKSRAAQLSRCLKFGNYEDCAIDGDHIAADEAHVYGRIASASGVCARAILEEGAASSDFGPTSCAAEWNDCDTQVPAIASLDDLADCLVCQQKGYDRRIRDALGWPRPAPADRRELVCTRGFGHDVAWAVRKAAVDTLRCAKGGTKPFDCAIDDGPTTRLAKALASLERHAARCGIDEGEAPGALDSLCAGAANSQDELVACFAALARCLACRSANALLDQSEDCAAYSGDPTCTGTF